MTSRRVRTRHPDVSGYPGSVLPAARAVSPRSAPDDSGTFCFADARYQHQSGGILLGGLESCVAVEQLAAEAMRPCVCCRDGLERCDVCQGRGCSEDRDTCDHCLGLGSASCDFCGGSGLVTCDAIAPPLRVAVAIERIREASRQLDAVMHRPADPSSRSSLRQSLEENGRALLATNRLAAVIEDALHLLEAESRKEPGGGRDLSRVIRIGLKRAFECFLRMRETMRAMTASAQWLAKLSGPRTASGEIAAKRAAFYASLLKRTEMLTGTGFERALLRATIERLRHASDPRRAGQDQSKEQP